MSTISAPRKTGKPQAAGTLVSFNPATGQPVGEVPMTPPEAIPAIVARARAAQPAWRDLGLEKRAEILRPVGRKLLDAAETLAATTGGDSLGGFTGPVGTATIAGQGGGTLVGPAGATWRDASGAYHGLVLGGMDLATRLRRTGVWGF